MVGPTAELVTLEGKRPVSRDWPNRVVSKDEAEAHLRAHGNLGLKTRHHPVIDVDVDDPQLAEQICDVVQQQLGPAPRRTRSNSSKTALVYATEEPMRKQKLVIGDMGAVEVLGDGQQAMIVGKHPSGVMVSWTQHPLQTELTAITQEQVEAALEAVTSTLEASGHRVRRSGTTEQEAPAQSDLIAPSTQQALDALRELDVNAYETRDEWLQVLAATKASVAPRDHDEALVVIQEWSAEWEGGNDPSYVEQTWKSLRPPYRVGWRFLADHAGVLPFEVEPAPEQEQEPAKRLWSFAEMLENPELLVPPQPIGPSWFAYPGKATSVSGREKESGKSTVCSFDASRVSHIAPVLWVDCEQDVASLALRFKEFGAHPQNTHYLDRPTSIEELEKVAAHVGAKAIYIDSLAAWVGLTHKKIAQASEGEEWQRIVLELKHLAHRLEAAVVVINHTAKSDEKGGIRGSTGIAAAFDMLARIASRWKSDPENLRRVSYLGRWNVEDMKIRYNEGEGFIRDGEPEWPTELELEPSVFVFVRDAEDAPTLRLIRDKVKGKNADIDTAVSRLISLGAIHRDKEGRGFKHYAEEGWVVTNEGHLSNNADPNGPLAGRGDDE